MDVSHDTSEMSVFYDTIKTGVSYGNSPMGVFYHTTKIGITFQNRKISVSICTMDVFLKNMGWLRLVGSLKL